jgi:hypothetical protein
MAINRLRVEWSGSVVDGPGLTTFYSTGFTAADMSAAVTTYFQDVVARVPEGCTWLIPNGGDVLDETTGELTGVWGTGGSNQVTSTGPGGWAAGVGLRHSLQTAGINNGRRVRGSFFLVPLTSAAYQDDGTVDTTALNTIDAAVQDLFTALNTEWVVWSRPTDTRPGSYSEVTGVTTPDRVSWLRSRRT